MKKCFVKNIIYSGSITQPKESHVPSCGHGRDQAEELDLVVDQEFAYKFNFYIHTVNPIFGLV